MFLIYVALFVCDFLENTCFCFVFLFEPIKHIASPFLPPNHTGTSHLMVVAFCTLQSFYRAVFP